MNLAQLDIQERVGKGGMGVVHRAVWKSPIGGVPVAVKFLTGNRQVGADVAFLREARAAARLSHPNIVTLLDAGRVREPGAPVGLGTPYLVMEWVDGASLENRRPTSWPETVGILRDLLRALGHAHGWGVLHRDIKPANVMLTADGSVRLADFGVGRLLDDPRPEAGSSRKRQIAGTPKYMAPEQVMAEWRDEGPWTDIYGLAAMTWDLVSGRPLFSGEMTDVLVAHARERPPPLEAQFHIPSGLRNWLYTALEKAPGDRFASAAEALKALDEIEDGERTSRYPVVKPGRATSQVSIHVSVPQRHGTDDQPVASELRAAGAALFGMRQPPIVGRATEKEMLWNALRRVYRLERSEVAVIRGAAGQGKTALADWLERRVREGGHGAVLRSRHAVDVAGESALTGAVLRWFRLDGLDAEDALERLATGLQRLGFEDARLLAMDFVARRWPSASQRRGLHAPGEWQRFLLEFARRVGRGGPTVWILDDVHLSEATREFIKLAAEVDFRLFVVATSRGEEDLEVRRSFDVALAPLTESAMRELVQAMLPLDPSLTDTLVDRAGGSPMFATQLLGDWVARAVLDPGPLGYRAPDDAVKEVPESIRAVWQERVRTALDGQGAAASDALNALAVMGQHVDLAEWREACHLLGVDDPDAVLEHFAPYGLVAVSNGSVGIPHSLLRETLLSESTDLRRQYVAAAEAVLGGASTPRKTERAARYLWTAGEHLPALDRLYEAVVAYDIADDDDAVICLAPVLQEWARETGEQNNACMADTMWRLSRSLRCRGGNKASVGALAEAREILSQTASLDELRANPDELLNRAAAGISMGLGLEAMYAGEIDVAQNHYGDAVELSIAAGLQTEAIQAASFRSDALDKLGRPADAESLIAQMLDGLDLETLEPGPAYQGYLQLGGLEKRRGNCEAAVAACERALELAVARGIIHNVALVHSATGDMFAYFGRFDEARVAMQHASRVYGSIGSWVASICDFCLLTYDVLSGDAAEGVTRARRFVEEYSSDAFLRYRSLALMTAAACECAAGSVEIAQVNFEEAAELVPLYPFDETIMLAVALLEVANPPFADDVRSFVEDHRRSLPSFYEERLNSIA